MRLRHTLTSATLAFALVGGGIAVPASALASAKAPASAKSPAGAAGKAPASTSTARYPYTAANPTKIDPWGAQIRQCTSFASWWLTSHGMKISHLTVIKGPKGSATLGNAAHWDAAARQAGYAVSSRPVVGAIAQWRSNERSTWTIPHGFTYVQAGVEGHVAVVRKVFSDGTALIQDYNGAVPLGSNTYRGKAPRYLLLHA